MEIVLEFEGRSRIMKMKKKATEADLRAAYDKLAEKDPVLQRRSVTHYSTFTTFNDRHKKDVELAPGDALRDGQVVKVFFASYAALEIPEESHGHVSQEKITETGSVDDTPNNMDEELAFMGSIGLHGHGRGTAQTASRSRQVLVQQPTCSKEAEITRRSATSSNTSRNNREDLVCSLNISSDSDEEYAALGQKAREENLNRLRELNVNAIRAQVQVPKVMKERRPKSKGTADKENRPRVMPLRAVRAKKVPNPTYDIDEEDQVENEGLHASPDNSDTDHGPVRTLQKKEKEKIIKRAPERKRRHIGQKITALTPLPAFPKALEESILNDLVYKHQTHTQRMNNFLREFIKDVTDDEYCSKEEFRIIKDKVKNRLETMQVQNIKKYETLLIKSFSASQRNARNYRWNKVPKRSANRLALPVDPPAATNRKDIRALTPEEADELLQKPVMNKETVLGALNGNSSLIRCTFMQKHSLREAMDTYPYLKETDLLLHDYSTRVPLHLDMLKKNFEDSLLPMASIFSVEKPQDELEKFGIIMKIQDYFKEENDNNYPCLQLWDASNSSADPLNNIPAAQAPAIVAMVNDKDIVSATLVFDKECLYILEKPTTFECIALVLSAYFVFQIEYPGPYVKLLQTLQHILHQERNYHKLVRPFFSTFNKAKKLISASSRRQ